MCGARTARSTCSASTTRWWRPRAPTPVRAGDWRGRPPAAHACRCVSQCQPATAAQTAAQRSPVVLHPRHVRGGAPDKPSPHHRHPPPTPTPCQRRTWQRAPLARGPRAHWPDPSGPTLTPGPCPPAHQGSLAPGLCRPRGASREQRPFHRTPPLAGNTAVQGPGGSAPLRSPFALSGATCGSQQEPMGRYPLPGGAPFSASCWTWSPRCLGLIGDSIPQHQL